MRQASVRVVDAAALAGGPAELVSATLAMVGPLPAADLASDGGGWLARLADLSGAPLPLDLFARVPRRPGWDELDAFAMATVYAQVVWDDRMPAWHAQTDRSDSAALLRSLHDLALRAYRNHDAGERLVVVGSS